MPTKQREPVSDVELRNLRRRVEHERRLGFRSIEMDHSQLLRLIDEIDELRGPEPGDNTREDG